MNKFLSFVLCLSLFVTVFSGITAVCAKDITVELDGNIIEFDVKPEIIDGRTMVPLRKIFEEIGAVVKWNNDTQTVSARKNSKTISLVIGSDGLIIDKGNTDEEGNPIYEEISLDVPAQLVNGRTLVPARAISESFGLNVEWDENIQKVIITSDDDEDDDSWKENITLINLTDLSFEGKGVEISGSQIKITAGGDYTITGTLSEGNITISTKEKVKLRLNGASVTSADKPCIFIEDADKAYITLTDGTQNYLVAKNSDDGAIYSKDNLEIKGDGALKIESMAGHGIKASDNFTIENGSLNITAAGDGIHVNDTFKMTGGAVNIISTGDGIDSESIAVIYGGKLDIETNAVPKEVNKNLSSVPSDGQTMQNRPMQIMLPEYEFQKSSKGINAEWMLCIYGGEFNLDSASHGIHCEDEIEINGGAFTISSGYEKGISAHGNLTISGNETKIDIVKSTEGIESKNVMLINDGTINIVSTDDGLNATGGVSGAMHGMGRGGAIRGFDKMPNGGVVIGSDGNFIPPMPGDKKTTDERFKTSGNLMSDGMPPHANGDMPPEWKNNGRSNGVNIMSDGQMPGRASQNNPQMNSGDFPGGKMGGMGKNMKDCLIINGGTIDLYAGDDGIDSNGNLVINGGVVRAAKSSGAFIGNMGILDCDGQLTIGKNAEIILVAGGGAEKGMSLDQNNISIYSETQHSADDIITVKDSQGNIIYEYTPKGAYTAVFIASNKLITGETYTVCIGEETHKVNITEQSIKIGTENIKTNIRNRFAQ